MKKGTYIDYQILLACLSKPVQLKKEPAADAITKPGAVNFKPAVEENSAAVNNSKAA